jgi:hypothetical protein
MSTTRSVAIVDDDRDSREECSLIVDALGWESRIVEGHFKSDLGALVETIAHTADYIICDQRLSFGNLAEWSGAEIAASLYDCRKRVVLVTTYLEPELPNIRRFGRKLPVVLSRDELNGNVLPRLFDQCTRELETGPAKHRRPYRALVDIITIDGQGTEQVAEAIIPAWNPRRAVTFELADLVEQVARDICAGTRLYADINLNARDSTELYFSNFSFLASPEEVEALG